MKVTWLCELANMTPQNYYARRSARRRQEVDVKLLLELAADLSGGYRTRGGVEFPAGGMRVLAGGSLTLPPLP